MICPIYSSDLGGHELWVIACRYYFKDTSASHTHSNTTALGFQ